MKVNDPELTGLGDQLIDYMALQVRIRLLERELKDINPKDSALIYLLQVELEKAYKSYLMMNQILNEIQLPYEIDDIMPRPNCIVPVTRRWSFPKEVDSEDIRLVPLIY